MNIAYRQNAYMPEPIERPNTPKRRVSLRHVVAVSAAIGIAGTCAAGNVGCGAGLTQQGIAAAEAATQCVVTIILDVTGVATTDPLTMASQCEVAIQDVYNFVEAELAMSQQVSADAGASPPTTPVTSVRVQTSKGVVTVKRVGYITAGQVSRLNAIEAAALKAGASANAAAISPN